MMERREIEPEIPAYAEDLVLPGEIAECPPGDLIEAETMVGGAKTAPPVELCMVPE